MLYSSGGWTAAGTSCRLRLLPEYCQQQLQVAAAVVFGVGLCSNRISPTHSTLYSSSSQEWGQYQTFSPSLSIALAWPGWPGAESSCVLWSFHHCSLWDTLTAPPLLYVAGAYAAACL